MSRLFAYMARYQRRYVGGAACLLATATLAMSIPYLLKRAIEVIERGGDPHELTLFASAIIAIAIVQGVVRTFSRTLIFNVGRDIEYDLRNDLFAHLEGLSLDYYQRSRTGDLMSRMVNDLNAVRMMLGPGILNLINTPLYYVWAVGFMVAIDPWLTFLSLLVYPVVLWVVKQFSRRLMERMVEVQEGIAALSSRIQENLAGIGVVKAYALERAEWVRFEAENRDFQAKSIEMARLRGMIVPVMRSVYNAGVIVVVIFGGSRAISGSLGIGDLVAFLAYLHLLAWPTMALGWMLSIVQRGRAAMGRLEEIFAVQPTVVDPPGADAHPVERGELEFENVSFSYPGSDTPVLTDVSFRVPAGTTLAVVGRTGAGKSSLVGLVPRLFDTTGGTVRVDGRDVRSMPLATLRRAIACVPQDPFLFSTTLRENVAYALDVGDDGGNGGVGGSVERAATIAALGEDLSVLPHGLETAVGERGVTLSGGQKQRVTIARAVAADARILILDDALASVDGETEREIRTGLRDAFPNRTQVIVSNRVATLEDADQVIVLDGGTVAEQGDHDTLLAFGGLYAALFQEQMLEAELEEL